MDEVWSSVFSSEEGDIVACGVGSQPTFHVERKRWADEASESGTSTLGSDVHSCADDAPVNKKNTVCSSTSHQGSRLPGHKYDFLPMDGGAGQLCKPCFEVVQHGGKEIKQKQFKKMVRRHFGSKLFSARPDNGLTKTGRRGRFAAFYFKHRFSILQECIAHGIQNVGLPEWLSMCSQVWKGDFGRLQCVASCVSNMQREDSIWRRDLAANCLCL